MKRTSGDPLLLESDLFPMIRWATALSPEKFQGLRFFSLSGQQFLFRYCPDDNFFFFFPLMSTLNLESNNLWLLSCLLDCWEKFYSIITVTILQTTVPAIRSLCDLILPVRINKAWFPSDLYSRFLNILVSLHRILLSIHFSWTGILQLSTLFLV